MGCAIDGALVGGRLLVRGMVLQESKVSDRRDRFMFENCTIRSDEFLTMISILSGQAAIMHV
jgi:hypothetical protein